MLHPVINNINLKRIVLASGSPRRQELLRNIGLNVEICPSLFEENLNPKDFNGFSDFVEETAHQKAIEVKTRLKETGRPADLVIAADTVVTLDGEIFGKPKNEEQAFKTLYRLSGRIHTVYTGVVLLSDSYMKTFTEKTNVQFGTLTEEQINAYIATGEPMDKAGGYGIQGVGGTFVERIEGDYFTVMGLPLYRLSSMLYDLFKEKTEGDK